MEYYTIGDCISYGYARGGGDGGGGSSMFGLR
jgi:hypothetical protein